MWRPAGERRVLLMAGQTTEYALEPRGEYVFGVVSARPTRSRRGHEHRLVLPGQLVAWDPSHGHAGTALDDQPWSARLMILEVADLAALAGDHELGDLTALVTPTTRLERDQRLAEWLHRLIVRAGATRPPRAPLSPHDEKGLRAALEYLGDQPERNIGLDELAAAAGLGKFRLLRIVRERTGLPPHALQLAHRLRKARRLLEAGRSVADTAAATGFADQSHFHRHFRRSLGVTPAEYQRRFDA
jgi:AraC-like DNA-binding protein